MNISVRLILCKGKYDHISESLQQLHWLPVKKRSEYKVLTITYKALHNMAPKYLSDLITPYISPRTLRSQDKFLLKPQKYRNNYGARSFKCMAPCILYFIQMFYMFSFLFYKLYQYCYYNGSIYKSSLCYLM